MTWGEKFQPWSGRQQSWLMCRTLFRQAACSCSCSSFSRTTCDGRKVLLSDRCMLSLCKRFDNAAPAAWCCVLTSWQLKPGERVGQSLQQPPDDQQCCMMTYTVVLASAPA